MKESTAWRVLAERFDAHESPWVYLCDNLSSVFGDEVIKATVPADVRAGMVARIKENLDKGAFTAYPELDDPFSGNDAQAQEARNSRVLACLMFAEQAADEEKAAA